MTAFGSSQILLDLIRRRKAGQRIGIYSICSTNRFVIDAAIKQAARNNSFVLIEATCNQVNQFGGYSGLTPRGFASMIRKILIETGLSSGQVLLGGDHLGPFPWRNESSKDAMAKAIEMVQTYAQAGFCKLHLDASMPCFDDDRSRPLDPRQVAERAAILCQAAEQALTSHPGLPPIYVIGTEVPPPGGIIDGKSPRHITDHRDAAESLESFREAFHRLGLTDAWQRVVAIVVQPGVEFGDDELLEYDPMAASGLAAFIAQIPGLVFEAHSTDYQPIACLKAMVDDQFAILKVGPALTFAFREAVFALAHMEVEWLMGRQGVELSGLIEVVEAAMMENTGYWRDYYRGDERKVAFARKYSQLDRIRYYWGVPVVNKALQHLLSNVEHNPLPRTLLSQYLPVQYRHLQAGSIGNQPRELIRDHIVEVLQDYHAACGYSCSAGSAESDFSLL